MRVSGPQSALLIEQLSGQSCPSPRRVVLRILSHSGAVIDRALVLYFKAPASFTGEDMAEFQVHGGRAVIRSLEKALENLGSRPAAPGEFSRRAFLNGKIDLTGAEALADLIAAESEAQQIQALAQAGGALEQLYKSWSKRLTHALAYVEASLDFADEELPEDMLESVRGDMEMLVREIAGHLGDARRGERLRTGFKVAILGAPNAGKSSLLNGLSQRDAAIVSHVEGTTRDVIEVHLDLGGFPVILFDTAGLRETLDEIEAEGIARAKATAESADVKLLLFDASRPRDPETSALADASAIVVLNKADLCAPTMPNMGEVVISTKDCRGMSQLLEILTGRIANLCGDMTRPAPTRERHATHLRDALQALRRFADAESIDLAAEDLRVGLRALGGIMGRVDIEDLLDIVFRDFCIGK